MNKFTFAVATICLSAILPAPGLAAPDMQPGRWEISSTIDMPGMGFSMPASKTTQCISREDLVPQTQQANEKCQMLENKVNGNTVTWKIRCESEGGTMTSQGELVYHGDLFEGTVNTTGSQMPAGMTQKMTGKRIGNCQ